MMLPDGCDTLQALVLEIYLLLVALWLCLW